LSPKGNVRYLADASDAVPSTPAQQPPKTVDRFFVPYSNCSVHFYFVRVSPYKTENELNLSNFHSR